MTEGEMVGWHHRLDGHEYEQAPVVMHRDIWHDAVHGVTKSQTQLSDRTELNVDENQKSQVSDQQGLDDKKLFSPGYCPQ